MSLSFLIFLLLVFVPACFFVGQIYFRRLAQIFFIIEDKYPHKFEELALPPNAIPEHYRYLIDDPWNFRKAIDSLKVGVIPEMEGTVGDLASGDKPALKERLNKSWAMYSLIRSGRYKILEDKEINALAPFPRVYVFLSPFILAFITTISLVVCLGALL